MRSPAELPLVCKLAIHEYDIALPKLPLTKICRNAEMGIYNWIHTSALTFQFRKAGEKKCWNSSAWHATTSNRPPTERGHGILAWCPAIPPRASISNVRTIVVVHFRSRIDERVLLRRRLTLFFLHLTLWYGLKPIAKAYKNCSSCTSLQLWVQYIGNTGHASAMIHYAWQWGSCWHDMQGWWPSANSRWMLSLHCYRCTARL